MAKNLILYYSRAGENYVNGSVQNIEKGNTEIVAEIMADVIDADLFKVETIRTYDASYMKCIEEAQQGEFEPLSEKEMLIELRTFLEHLTCDCALNTHHTSGIHLSGDDFLGRKEKILQALTHQIKHGDMDRLEMIRKFKRTL